MLADYHSTGIVRYAISTTGGLSSPVQTTAIDQISELASDGSFLYVVSAANDSLSVLDANSLSVLATVSGASLGLDGASDLALSADGNFVYVTGKGGHTLSVFELTGSPDYLKHVETYTNGQEGISGMVDPTDVAITPDGKYVLVTGELNNSISVFQRNATDGTALFVQVVRNHIAGVEGLRAPRSLGLWSDGTIAYVGSAGDGVNVGGLVRFGLDTSHPAPIDIITTFDHVEDLGVQTAAGEDIITLVNAPELEVGVVRVDTGSNADLFVLTNALDQGRKVEVDLGDDADEAQLRADTVGAIVEVQAGPGDDVIDVQLVGDNTVLEVFGNRGDDDVFVDGMGLSPTATTTAHGNSHPGGDTLYFDPQNPTPGTPNYSPAPPDNNAGSVAVTGQGTLTYDTFEGPVVIVDAPLITFPAGPFTTREGQGVSLSADVNLLGNQLVGEVLWDIDGDGRFGDAAGDTFRLTWDQLVDFGINDDGVYQIGVTATNDLGFTSTEFTTLTVANKQPTVLLTGPGSVPVGQPITVDFSATDPGDDRVFEWRINWVDGTPIEILGSEATSATHVYTRPGNFRVFAGAVDEDSAPSPVPSNPLDVTVTLSANEIDPGGPYTIVEGDSLTLSGSAAGIPLGFVWDLNRDAQIDATGATPTFTWADLQALGITDNGLYRIGFGVVYPGGQAATTTDFLRVLNAPPTILSVSNDGPILEGGQVTVSVSASDPAGAADPLTYEFDFDGDGTFETPGPSGQAQYSFAENGTYLVEFRVGDGDNGVTFGGTTVEVLNVAPTLTLSGPVTGNEGDTVTLNLSRSNVGADGIDFWTVNWGDNTIEIVTGDPSSADHVYKQDGVYTISATATDEDGVYAAENTVTATIDNVAPRLENVVLEDTYYPGEKDAHTS